MLNVLKLGHAEFEVRDVERMAEFYSRVIGLTETGRDGQTVYLSTSIDHHSIVLRGGASKTLLSKLAFQIAPAADGDLTKRSVRISVCEALAVSATIGRETVSGK